MRLRLNDVSYTVSEMPRELNENVTQEDDLDRIPDDQMLNEEG